MAMDTCPKQLFFCAIHIMGDNVRRLSLFAVTALVLSNPVLSAEPAAVNPANTAPQTSPIAPAASVNKNPTKWPKAPEYLDGWDWIQFTSGEWLKGEIIGLYDQVLDFDSDQLDDLSIDWDDVARVLSSQSMSIRLESGDTVIGPVKIDQKTLAFAGPVKSQYSRNAIVSMSASGEHELDLWQFRIGFAGSVKGGNVDERSFDTDVDLTRRSARSRFAFSYDAGTTEVQGVRTEESHRANSRYDVFISPRTYWTPGYVEYFRDRFQNIEHRATVGVFIGYYIADSDRVTWTVSGGPGYQYLEYTTAPAGSDKTEETPALLADTQLEYDITGDITYTLKYQPQFTNNATGNYKHYIETGLNVDLTDRLELTLSYDWNYTDKPQADENGIIPEQDDYTISVGVAWDY
jgi:putative salt-induced outer membrane protein YdiY